ncbi:hypothetical protein BC937DRAFT_87271 [Endogone sp. FLAS-F59071]|nr:hypothetical protein BC937DRAFT_87271 [Endogone sp. FLAS-F59071]|eukprot:RUS19565.1 hypothetical protein BC937DRAFT_87271 [Endogone sp. FLAS-F59071]
MTTSSPRAYECRTMTALASGDVLISSCLERPGNALRYGLLQEPPITDKPWGLAVFARKFEIAACGRFEPLVKNPSRPKNNTISLLLPDLTPTCDIYRFVHHLNLCHLGRYGDRWVGDLAVPAAADVSRHSCH